jgi:hypothetical protein
MKNVNKKITAKFAMRAGLIFQSLRIRWSRLFPKADGENRVWKTVGKAEDGKGW